MQEVKKYFLRMIFLKLVLALKIGDSVGDIFGGHVFPFDPFESYSTQLLQLIRDERAKHLQHLQFVPQVLHGDDLLCGRWHRLYSVVKVEFDLVHHSNPQRAEYRWVRMGIQWVHVGYPIEVQEVLLEGGKGVRGWEGGLDHEGVLRVVGDAEAIA